MVKALKAAGHYVLAFEWGETFPKESLDLVIHLGAISSTAERDVGKIMAQNFDFTVDLLETCNSRRIDVQYASSASIYGLGSDFRETATPDPRTPYAWSKLAVDRYVMSRKQANHWSINVQGFRYFNVYGPHEEHKDQPSPFTTFERQAKESGVIKVFQGSDKIYRDFVHVDDVINIQKRFFTINKTGIWNIGSGVARTFMSIAEEIADQYEAKITVIPMPDSIIKDSYQTYTRADLTWLNMTLSGINT